VLQLVRAFGEINTHQGFTSLFQGLGSAYQQDPVTTTSTLAAALQLANREEDKAQAAAAAITAALEYGGKGPARRLH
jgi:hypothetical protein